MQSSEKILNNSVKIERELEEKVEVLALIKQIEDYKLQLTNLLSIWYRHQTEIKQKLMFEYDILFGQLEEDICNRNLMAEALEHKYNLLNHRVKNNGKITPEYNNFVDELVEYEKQQKIENFREKSSYKLYQSRFSKSVDNISKELEFNDQYDISALYKLIVRQLHPDIAGASMNQQLLWHTLQFCYKQRDLERIIMLYLLICHDTRFDFSNDAVALETFIVELKENINKQKQDIANMRKQEPFCFDGKLDNTEWINSHRNKLRQNLLEINKKITKNRQLINNLNSKN